MSLYRVLYNYNGNKSIQPLNSLGLTSLFYRSIKGPLGFEIDNIGEEILYELINNSLWYSIKRMEFVEVNRTSYDNHKYDLKGIIFLSEEGERERLNEAREKLNAIKKNKLLQRYNKQLIPVMPNDIVDVFDGNEYNYEHVAKLIIGRNTIIWNWDDMGGHLLYHRFSGCLLDKRLEIVSSNLGENVKDCSIVEVPYW